MTAPTPTPQDEGRIQALGALLDGEADARDALHLSQALEADAGLRAEFAALGAGQALLRAAYAPSSVALRDPLAGHVAQAFASRRSRQSWRRVALPMAAGLLVAALGLGGGYVSSGWRVDQAMARLEAAQVQQAAALTAAVGRALESATSGAQVNWVDPDTGVQAEVRPVRTWRSASGHWCRAFQQELRLGPAAERQDRVACRTGSGTWEPVAGL
ncbi:hypothetical protein [Zavarzinia sp. CC-PAN008]|uniref:hypothetical protein n=1 Tax=Zavarzinia sp. CC-PAN008 TaxID=3243332 RepID=UPI003F7489D0